MKEQLDALLTGRGIEWAVFLGICVVVFAVYLRYGTNCMKGK